MVKHFLPATGILLSILMVVFLSRTVILSKRPWCWFAYGLSLFAFYLCTIVSPQWQWEVAGMVAIAAMLCLRQLRHTPAIQRFHFQLLVVLLALRMVAFLPLGEAMPVFALMLDAALLSSLLLVFDMQNATGAAVIVSAYAAIQEDEPDSKIMHNLLNDRAELFIKVFELVPEALVICRDSDGCYVAVNNRWTELTGLSRVDMLGKAAGTLNVWCDMRQRSALHAAMNVHGSAWNFDADLRHRNGTTQHCRISGIRFESGGESLVMYVIENMTALRLAEHRGEQVQAQLQEREKHFLQIFDLVPDAISITSMQDGLLVDVNRVWESLTGHPRAEVIGKRTDEDLNLWVHVEKRELMMQLLAEQGEVAGFEILLRKKNNDVLFCEACCCIFERAGQSYLLAVIRDVTLQVENEIARKRAELHSHQSEQQLRAVLAAMREGIVVINTHSHILLCNQAAEDIFGVKKNELETIFSGANFRFKGEDGAYLTPERLPIWKTLKDGSPQRNIVVGLERQDMEIKWVHLSSDPIFSETDSSRVESVVILLVDISEMKRTEARLREREQLFATVFQLVPDTLTITRLSDGRYIDVNRNWEPMSGFSRNEIIGCTSGEINLWADMSERDALVRDVLTFGEVREKLVHFRRKDQTVVICRVSGSAFSSGGETYLFMISRNIEQELSLASARQTAEIKLRENEYKYSSIFQFSPIPLGLVDMTTGMMLEVNDAWTAQFGFDRNEVVGETSASLNFWIDPAQRSPMLKALQETGQVDCLEMQHRCKNGGTLTCLMSVRLFDLITEKVYIFSLVDITRQLQVEHEIRELAAGLEERVALRTQKLEQANRELAETLATLKRAQNKLIQSEKMAALGSLVAGVAHELNTPIGNSVTVASTLQDKTKDLLKDVEQGQLRRSVLEQYLHSADTGTALLMRTLDVAKELIANFKQVAVDQASSQRRNFDLQLVIQEVLSTLTPMYKKTAYTLETDLAPEIEMDSFPGILGQVLTNFMTNALAHAFEGCAEGQMHIRTRKLDDSYAELSFEDNGVGIDEMDQKHVFDPFFTTKLGQGGSGLGMNIVYNLVTGVLGGDIQLQSTLGAGTKITVILPLVAPVLATENQDAEN